MKLLTKTLQKQLPALYSQEKIEDPIVRAHFFNPSGQGDWWILEGQSEGAEREVYDGTEDDYMMFGLCDLGFGFPELGYVSMNELQSVKGSLGLGIERDLYWTPVPLSEVRAKVAS